MDGLAIRIIYLAVVIFPQHNSPIFFYINVDSRGSYEIEISTSAQSQFVNRSCVMESRVLDPHLAELAEGAKVGVVKCKVAIMFSELRLSIQAKKYDKSLSGNNFDTVGALRTLTPRDLLELGVSQGHIALTMNALFPSEEQMSGSNTTAVSPTSPSPPMPPRARSGPEFCELSASGAPESKNFRAWVIKFIVHLHLLVLPSTIDAVRQAGQDPLNVGGAWVVAGE